MNDDPFYIPPHRPPATNGGFVIALILLAIVAFAVGMDP
jgi:hypothetical protein